MNDFDSENGPENEWDDRGDLVWNEFDWERYLREQDETIKRYLALYESLQDNPNRIDEAAGRMGWEQSSPDTDSDDEVDEPDDEDGLDEFIEDKEVYTLHKNPVFVATKAIYLSLKRPWELVAADETRVPPTLAIPFLASLHRGEENAVQAIHALDFGDFSMAISLFKRALSSLNGSLALLNDDAVARHKTVRAFREAALPRLFDLREIWLRVINECRQELNRPVDEEN